MTGTPQQFKASIERWRKKAGAQLHALARQSCYELAQRVVMATPVDTGFLRGSWQPSIGAPVLAAGPADKAGAAALSQIGLTIAQLQPGDVFHMTNGASYGWFVEAGTAHMAGQHFVKSTLAQWPQIVEAMAKDLRL
jgi:hypothetical protein